MPRIDAKEKVTGDAIYGQDIYLDGMLFARVKRSEYPHARIMGIETARARRLKGVAAIATAEDIPGTNIVKLLDNDQPALVPVGGRIRHVEEPVALVAGPTAWTLVDGLVPRVGPLPEPLPRWIEPGSRSWKVPGHLGLV